MELIKRCSGLCWHCERIQHIATLADKYLALVGDDPVTQADQFIKEVCTALKEIVTL